MSGSWRARPKSSGSSRSGALSIRSFRCPRPPGSPARETESPRPRTYSPPVRSYPKPEEKPQPPVRLGGGATNVLERVIAWGDGWLLNRVTQEELREKRAPLDRLAKDAGRDPAANTISV